MKKKIIVAVLLLGAALCGYFGYAHYIREKTEENKDRLVLYGNVEIRRVNLGFRVSGRISEIMFDEGEEIKKGETIARLDREPYEYAHAIALAQMENASENFAKLEAGNRPQEIEQARASLNERIASLDVLESDFKRMEQFVASNAVSVQEYKTPLRGETRRSPGSSSPKRISISCLKVFGRRTSR